MAGQWEGEWLRKTLAHNCLGRHTSLIGLAERRPDYTVGLESGIVHDQTVLDYSGLVVPTISGREHELDRLLVHHGLR